MSNNQLMTTPQIIKINPTFHSHEGYTYLEWEGTFYKGCKRCGGEGHYSFNGEHSLCYECYNTEDKLGADFSDEAAAKKWCHEKLVRRLQRERAAEAARVAKLAKRQAAWDSLATAHPDVYELLDNAMQDGPIYDEDGNYTGDHRYTEKNGFVGSLAQRMFSLDEAPLTDKQIDALQQIVENRKVQAAEADAHPAPSGRVIVTGEVLSAKTRETDFGTQYKILVKDDAGFKVWCSIPKAQADEAWEDFQLEIKSKGHSLHDFGPACWFLGDDNGTCSGVKGKRITFTATLEPSHDDKSFAFGSRPTKGAWL